MQNENPSDWIASPDLKKRADKSQPNGERLRPGSATPSRRMPLFAGSDCLTAGAVLLSLGSCTAGTVALVAKPADPSNGLARVEKRQAARG
jgi:hypothetical protein